MKINELKQARSNLREDTNERLKELYNQETELMKQFESSIRKHIKGIEYEVLSNEYGFALLSKETYLCEYGRKIHYNHISKELFDKFVEYYKEYYGEIE